MAWLAERHEDAKDLGAAQSRRIEENRFVAARHGLDGHFADVVTGEPRPVRELLQERIETLAPVAERLGCGAELAGLSLERNGALRQRAVGLPDVTGRPAARFLG